MDFASQSARCIEDVLKNLDKIEQTISDRDYKIAAEQLETALYQSQYYPLKRHIEELHCGPSFITAVESLRDSLKEKNVKFVKKYMQMARAYGAQTRLPGRG